MMLSEQELEFPKLFPSLLKTVRPLLSISHANKESDFFRENVPHHSVAPGKASTCISGSAYNTRGTTIDTTRYRHKSAKHKSEEAGGDANAGDPQTHMTLACTEGVACNLSSGSYCTGSYCTPLQRAPLSAKYVSAPTFCVADQRLEHAAGSAHAGERGCKSDVSVAEGAGTWDVASGMAGVGLGLGIACAAAACIRFMRRC